MGAVVMYASNLRSQRITMLTWAVVVEFALLAAIVLNLWVFNDPFTIKNAAVAADRSAAFTTACQHDGGTVIVSRPSVDTLNLQCSAGSMRARKPRGEQHE